MKDIKILIKPFIFLFLVNLLIFNWNHISWVFNYHFLSTFVSSYFEDEEINNNVFAQSREYSGEYSDKENSIEIPRINVSSPLIIAESSENSFLQTELNKGAVYYPNSVLPGEKGQTVILGHSAPPNWPKLKYKWIFSDLNKLEEGDEIFVYFNHRKYSYKVKEKIILEKGQEIPQLGDNSNNSLVLVSCWPPGKDYKRILVWAKPILN